MKTVYPIQESSKRRMCVREVYHEDDVLIIEGDSRQALAEIPDNTFQCCVTSPPYWGLREDGTLWLNIGDSYTSGDRRWRAPDKKNAGRAMSYRPPTPKGLKPKACFGKRFFRKAMMDAQHVAEVAQEAVVDQVGLWMPFNREERLPELIDHALDKLKLRPREFTQRRSKFVNPCKDGCPCHGLTC